jgi:hypothetical protein
VDPGSAFNAFIRFFFLKEKRPLGFKARAQNFIQFINGKDSELEQLSMHKKI